MAVNYAAVDDVDGLLESYLFPPAQLCLFPVETEHSFFELLVSDHHLFQLERYFLLLYSRGGVRGVFE
jgi:hypothetical protein